MIQEKATPELIYRALRTAIRSTLNPQLNPVLQDMGTKSPRLKGWGFRNGLACLRGAPRWPSSLREDVKNTIISSQVKDTGDHERAQINVRLSSRLLTLQGLGKWLTNRAGPHTDVQLRTRVRASAVADGRARRSRGQHDTRSTATTVEPAAVTNTSGSPEPPDDQNELLTRGVNWQCSECQQHFDGDIGARPPSAAPPRWCKGCKRTRRLTYATCMGCNKVWKRCICVQASVRSMQALAIMPGEHTQIAENSCAGAGSARGTTPHHTDAEQDVGQPLRWDTEGVIDLSTCEDGPGNNDGGTYGCPRGTVHVGHGANGRRPAIRVQQSIRQFGAAQVYWERQQGSALCAVHAVNCLLQREAVDAGYMHAIALRLDGQEQRLLTDTAMESNAGPDGNFTIQVIEAALAAMGDEWRLTDARNPVSARLLVLPHGKKRRTLSIRAVIGTSSEESLDVPRTRGTTWTR